MLGENPQNGQSLLRGMLAKLSSKEGIDWATDDVSGVELNPEMVKEARRTEIKFFDDMHVYDRAPRDHQKQTGGKAIGVRWVDVNKGDTQTPDYRSRLVGQEFATHRDDSLYLSTPPIEALRVILSYAATIDEGEHMKQVLIADVKRAYFHALAQRNLYIELPKEDDKGDSSMLGKLRLNLYGTRDGAVNWQKHLSAHLGKLGYLCEEI